MNSKPDLDYFGFVGLSDDGFQTKFGNLSTFLNAMFEKHDGEIIYIDKCVAANVAWHPGTMALHHEQFHCGAEEEQTKARESARYAWEGAKKNSERSLETSLRYHGHVPTVVYQPKAASGAFNRRTDTLDDVTVAYFSLPA